jgi:hypothetical protein
MIFGFILLMFLILPLFFTLVEEQENHPATRPPSNMM